jgi:hypothetical protein
MEDKRSLLPAVDEHHRLFGEGQLQQIGTDKNYYNVSNLKVETDGRCTSKAMSFGFFAGSLI